MLVLYFGTQALKLLCIDNGIVNNIIDQKYNIIFATLNFNKLYQCKQTFTVVFWQALDIIL
jgi:hypothetical protein